MELITVTVCANARRTLVDHDKSRKRSPLSNAVLFFSGRIQEEYAIWLYRWRVRQLKMRVGDVVICINKAIIVSLQSDCCLRPFWTSEWHAKIITVQLDIVNIKSREFIHY